MSKQTNKPLTYLVTGGAGFIGSHLSEALLEQGHRVLAIDDLSTGVLSNVAGMMDNPRYHFCRASITDEVVLDRLVSESQIVIHLAAAVGVKLIVERPVHTIETNVGGTESVLRSARRYNCRTLIASTSEVYGKGSKVPFAEEDDVLLGSTGKNRWAYAASKMLDEFLGLAYMQEFGLPVVLFRLFNTVGPRQTGQYGMVIPRLVGQALQNQPITVFGDGQQKRCFCDARDSILAIMGLATHPDAPGRVYNIGGTEEISMLALAERIRTLVGSKSEIVKIPYAEAYAPGFEDMQRRVPDISRIGNLLGWKPTRETDRILRDVIDFEAAKLRAAGKLA